MTKEQNVVITFYLFVAAASFAGLFQGWHKMSAFLFMGFLLAYVLKMVNSIEHNKYHHEQACLPLLAATPMRGEPNDGHVRR